MSLTVHPLASGAGWQIRDVVCTAGPHDRPFEEQHAAVSIAIVSEGSFQYRSSYGAAVLGPGSLLLGSPGRCFECCHEHAAGDRCLSFHYEPAYFEALAGAVMETLAGHAPVAQRPSALDEWRVTRALRRIEAAADETLSVEQLADEAATSPFHFLRLFRQIVGLTPHQYILRTRLHRAAIQLRRSDAPSPPLRSTPGSTISRPSITASGGYSG